MHINEINCKSVLTPTKLAAIDYTINPYFGCSHGCVYCYCRELAQRFRKHTERWGRYIDVKVNAPDVLRRQLGKQQRGIVWLSSATDPYQPVERRYALTRAVLEVLLESKLKVDILSKGALVIRDIDLFKRFGSRIRVGFTINMLDESVCKLLEPATASITQRIEQLQQLREAAIPIYAAFGPVFPGLTDIAELFKLFSELGIRYVFTESFNTRGSNWTEFKTILETAKPELLPVYQDIFFNSEKRRAWHAALARQIRELAARYKIRCDIYFELSKKFKSKSHSPRAT